VAPSRGEVARAIEGDLALARAAACADDGTRAEEQRAL
jgi:hypothetical protein